MKLERRLKRLEKEIDGINLGRGEVYLLIMNEKESHEECLARYGYKTDMEGLKIFVIPVSPGDLKRD